MSKLEDGDGFLIFGVGDLSRATVSCGLNYRNLFVISDDRGHVVERSRNRRTNDTEENQEYLNIDEGNIFLE